MLGKATSPTTTEMSIKGSETNKQNKRKYNVHGAVHSSQNLTYWNTKTDANRGKYNFKNRKGGS